MKNLLLRGRGRAHIAGERRVPVDLIKQRHTFHRKSGNSLSRPFATGPLKAARSFPTFRRNMTCSNHHSH